MILGCWQGAQKPVGQHLPPWLPALLNRVQFRGPTGKIQYPECLPVALEKFLNFLALMIFGMVNNKEYPAPATTQQCHEFHKTYLVVLLAKSEYE